MPPHPKSRRRRRKQVLMKRDGSLYDVSEQRPITQAELRDHVRDGGLFEARRHESGSDCTMEVLQSVMSAAFVQHMVPGFGGGGGLGGLAGLAGLANAGGGLAEIVRALGGGGDRCGDWGDWDERPRERKADNGGGGDDEPETGSAD